MYSFYFRPFVRCHTKAKLRNTRTKSGCLSASRIADTFAPSARVAQLATECSQRKDTADNLTHNCIPFDASPSLLRDSKSSRKAAGENLIQFSNATENKAQAKPPLSMRYQSLCSNRMLRLSVSALCDKSIWNRCQRQRATDSHVNCQTHVRKRQTDDDFIVVGDSQNFV